MAGAKSIAVLIVIFALFFLSGCSNGFSESVPGEQAAASSFSIYDKSSHDEVMLYYIKDNYLTPFTVSIDSPKEPVMEALTKLFHEPAPEGFVNTLYGIELKGFSIDGNMALLDVSKKLLDDKAIKNRLDQMLFTLTEFENIKKVKITVDGDLEEIYERPRFINTIISQNETLENLFDTSDLNYVTVYYADKDKKYLIPITLNSDKIPLSVDDKGEIVPPTLQQKAEAALKHLIEGPKDLENLTGIFPENVIPKFHIKDTTAYVDVSKQILFDFRDKAEYEKIAVESIVLTLTEIEEIDRVQFLVDGNVIGSIAGHINISNPIPRPRWYNYYQ